MTEEYELINNTKKRRYEFQIGERIAMVEYLESGNGKICFTHTEVPSSIAGQGIATQLVEKALKDVEEKGLKLNPLCPFVEEYIRKHPKWKRLVQQGI